MVHSACPPLAKEFITASVYPRILKIPTGGSDIYGMLLTKVVFCVSLTWYAQKLSPDSQTNKMHEAIKVI